MEEVLWPSGPSLLSKSILVKMPRLPTMRVMGSQFISTRLRCFSSSSGMVSGYVAMAWSSLEWLGVGTVWMVAGGELRAVVAPLGFLIDGGVGDAAEGADHTTVATDDCGRDHGSGRFVHEGHEFVGE